MLQEIRAIDETLLPAQIAARDAAVLHFERRMKIARLLEQLQEVIADDFEIVVRLRRG